VLGRVGLGWIEPTSEPTGKGGLEGALEGAAWEGVGGRSVGARARRGGGPGEGGVMASWRRGLGGDVGW
jgi:hypothetical protein